jgi:hypothetical protein
VQPPARRLFRPRRAFAGTAAASTARDFAAHGMSGVLFGAPWPGPVFLRLLSPYSLVPTPYVYVPYRQVNRIHRIVAVLRQPSRVV